MYLEDKDLNIVNGVELVQDIDNWRVLDNVVLKPRISGYAGLIN